MAKKATSKAEKTVQDSKKKESANSSLKNTKKKQPKLFLLVLSSFYQ